MTGSAEFDEKGNGILVGVCGLVGFSFAFVFESAFVWWVLFCVLHHHGECFFLHVLFILFLNKIAIINK